MARLENKVAIVTGAAGGIGLAIADLFAKEGAAVVATDINVSLLESNIDRINTSGGKALAIGLDVRDEQNWQDVFAVTQQQFGQANILVNNAGIVAQGTIEDTDLDSWRNVMSVNLDGTFLGCKQAVMHMKEQGGVIVNVSSIGALKGSLVGPAYGASKAAVWNLTKTVALYCAKSGYQVRCNSLHPGLTETPLLSSASDDVLNRLKVSIPMGKLAEANDIAYAALYLASDEAKYTTGTSLIVDGGTLAQ